MSTYTDAHSPKAYERLTSQYGTGAKRYGAVASWGTMAKGFYYDITGNSIASSFYKSNHPAQLHYGFWDDSHIKSFDDAIRYATDRAFKELFPNYKDNYATVIHFGSGFGGVEMQLCKTYKNIRCTGISIDPLQISVARELAVLHGVDRRAQYIQGNFFDKKNFSASGYDGGIALESFGHVPQSQLHELWEVVSAVIKPKARFVIHDWYAHRRLNKKETVKMEMFLRGWDLAGCFSDKLMIDTAKQSGFRLIVDADVTHAIIKSAQEIWLRALVFKPIVWAFQNSPIAYIQSLGITKPETLDFADTCFIQKKLFTKRILIYHQLVFEKI